MNPPQTAPQTDQNPAQYQFPPQGIPSAPSTSAYTSSGQYASIDPNVLLAQYAALQRGNLPTGATIAPQFNTPARPETGASDGILTDVQVYAISQYISDLETANLAADAYIKQLEAIAAYAAESIEFSTAQDSLIQQFLNHPEFVLNYIRGSWINYVIPDNFMDDFSKVYLEIANEYKAQNPDTTADPNTANSQQFAKAMPSAPVLYQLPPIPQSTGTNGGTMTFEQYQNALESGQSAQAKAAAILNPASLYAELFK